MLAIAAIVLLSTVLCVTVEAHSYDYCTLPCPRKHVLCTTKSNGGGLFANMCKGYSNGLSEEDKTFILQTLNQLRARVANGLEPINSQPAAADMMELEWDHELADAAQAHASDCMTAMKDDCPVRIDNTPYQQVLDDDYMPVPPGDARRQVIKIVIQKWYEGVYTFKPQLEIPTQNNRLAIDVKDKYAQLVWSKTNRVGCGYSASIPDNGKMYLFRMVCNFTPPGNANGQAVYLLGRAASACPTGSTPSTMYPGLCKGQ